MKMLREQPDKAQWYKIYYLFEHFLIKFIRIG